MSDVAIRRLGKNKLSFVEQNFEIHGEFEGKVYHRKRDGDLEIYPYDPVSYYERTPLVIRNEVIRRYAAYYTNPRWSDYSEIIRKLNYYTPYILYQGAWRFRGETVFYVRKRDEFEFRFDDSAMGFQQMVGKSTKVRLNFTARGEFLLNCYHEGELYCQRWFIITSDDLQTAYENWLDEHIEEILADLEPEYESIKTYRRGMRSRRNWMKDISGAYYEEVVYAVHKFAYKDQKGENPWLYHRRKYDHSGNPQTIFFDNRMKILGAEWQSLSEAEREKWNRKAALIKKKRWTGFNLFVKERIILTTENIN